MTKQQLNSGSGAGDNGIRHCNSLGESLAKLGKLPFQGAALRLLDGTDEAQFPLLSGSVTRRKLRAGTRPGGQGGATH